MRPGAIFGTSTSAVITSEWRPSHLCVAQPLPWVISPERSWKRSSVPGQHPIARSRVRIAESVISLPRKWTVTGLGVLSTADIMTTKAGSNVRMSVATDT